MAYIKNNHPVAQTQPQHLSALGSRVLEAGRWKQGVGSRALEAGRWKQGVGRRPYANAPGFKVPGSGQRSLWLNLEGPIGFSVVRLGA